MGAVRLAFWRPPFLRRRCLITTKSAPDSVFEGVLWESRGSWLVLRQCALIRVGETSVPFDGEVVIHRDNLFFAQVP